MLLGEADAGLDGTRALVRARAPGQQDAFRDERIRDDPDGLDPLRSTERPVREVDRLIDPVVEPVRTGELVFDVREGSIIGEVGERLRGRLEELDGSPRVPRVDHPPAQRGRGASSTRAIAERQAPLDQVAQGGLRELEPAGVHRGDTGLLHQLGDLGRVVGDLDRLGEEHHRLVVAAERGGAGRRRSERDPRLRGERPAVRIVRRGAERVEVVRRERARQLLLARATRRTARRPGAGTVDRAGRASRRPPRGSAPGRTSTGHARRSADRGRGRAARGGRGTRAISSTWSRSRPLTAASAVEREALAQHGRVLDHGSLRAGQRVQPRGDERVERLGDREVGQVAGRARSRRPRARAGPPRRASGSSRSRTAGCRPRAPRWTGGAAGGRPGTSAVRSVVDRRVGERLQPDRDEVPAARRPSPAGVRGSRAARA